MPNTTALPEGTRRPVIGVSERSIHKAVNPCTSHHKAFLHLCQVPDAFTIPQLSGCVGNGPIITRLCGSWPHNFQAVLVMVP